MARIGYFQEPSYKYRESDFTTQIWRLYNDGDIKGASALYALMKTPLTEDEFDTYRARFESKDGGLNLI